MREMTLDAYNRLKAPIVVVGRRNGKEVFLHDVIMETPPGCVFYIKTVMGWITVTIILNS